MSGEPDVLPALAITLGFERGNVLRAPSDHQKGHFWNHSGEREELLDRAGLGEGAGVAAR